jgi:hypothetical protein
MEKYNGSYFTLSKAASPLISRAIDSPATKQTTVEILSFKEPFENNSLEYFMG